MWRWRKADGSGGGNAGKQWKEEGEEEAEEEEEEGNHHRHQQKDKGMEVGASHRGSSSKTTRPCKCLSASTKQQAPKRRTTPPKARMKAQV